MKATECKSVSSALAEVWQVHVAKGAFKSESAEALRDVRANLASIFFASNHKFDSVGFYVDCGFDD